MGTIGRSLIVVCALAGTSAGDPLLRFGLTSGADRNTPEGAQIGPMLAGGGTAGPFSGEVNYAYLSFFDTETRIHRAGVTLRMDVVQWIANQRNGYTKSIYLEVGAGKRWGQWRVNQVTDAHSSGQNEVHIGVGYQLARAWQLGVRLGASRVHPELGTTCRGVCMGTMPVTGGVAQSVMLEWMFLLGR